MVTSIWLSLLQIQHMLPRRNLHYPILSLSATYILAWKYFSLLWLLINSRASIFLYYSSILHVFPFLSPITCMFIFLTNPDGWHTFWEQDLKCRKDLYAFKDLIVSSLLVAWSLESKFHLILVTEQPWKCSWGLCLQLDRTFGHDQGLKINHSSLLKLEGGYLAVFLAITKGGWQSGWMDG